MVVVRPPSSVLETRHRPGSGRRPSTSSSSADADGLLGPADLPVLGEVAYAAGHLDVTIEAWERAYAACTQAGDDVAAAGAAVRLAMHLLFDTALMAPVRGWLARAERLLDGKEETPAHAWFAVVRTYERILTGDTPSARGNGPGAPSTSVRCGTRRRAPSDGWQKPDCSSSTATCSKGWRCSTRPGWRRCPGSSIRSRRGSSSASSCARCRASPSTRWPRSGPRRWSAGARPTPSGASMAAAGSTVRRSSGCAGRATKRRTRP